ncbi:hypothetical protein A5724_06770 [Mycobacterium sp. ACS1612]|uniref:hypothetical protein n=1 Tax=Mycobacterium sp. ACS1612 TaxID=1834117 RepID=UPI0008009569|nr:hypothetical protein [Mycobacterium sp. ACS1612]OBF40761.1 hypothetical protein A5724_06770 [Mycobacterium sp. ACS1612]
MTRRILAIIAVIAAITLSSGCDTNTTKSSSTASNSPAQLYLNWPPLLNDFRFHWTAEPGIDVTTGPAMVVRAYMEAYNTAWYTLNLDNLWPGFRRATPENQEPQGDFLWQLVSIRPLGSGYTKTAKDARPHFGYQVLHFLELTPMGNGYRAIVCSGEYAHFVESTARPGKFISIGVNEDTAQPFRPGDNGVFPYQIALTQHDPRIGPNPPAPVTVPQRGPAPAPDTDVFGNWFITGASSSYWGPSNDPNARDFPSPELIQRCGAAMPVPEAERIAIMTGFKDQPPQHGEAIPGWPAKAQ